MKFLQDLGSKFLQWQANGKEVIVHANMNEDILAKDIKQFCQEVCLVEAIAILHGPSPNPMHQRGSKSMDSIFLSPSLVKEAKEDSLDLEKSQSATIEQCGLTYQHTTLTRYNPQTLPSLQAGNSNAKIYR